MGNLGRKSKSRNRRREPSHLRYAWGAVFLVVAGLLLLCLISYDPTDVAANQSPPNLPPNNWFGPIGATAAYHLLLGLGFAAFPTLGILFLLALYALVSRKEKIWPQVMAGMFLALLTILLVDIQPWYLDELLEDFNLVGIGKGGMFSRMVMDQFLVPYLGQVGTAVLLVLGAFFSLLGVIRLSLANIIGGIHLLFSWLLAPPRWLFQKVRSGWDSVQERAAGKREIERKAKERARQAGIASHRKSPQSRVSRQRSGNHATSAVGNRPRGASRTTHPSQTAKGQPRTARMRRAEGPKKNGLNGRNTGPVSTPRPAKPKPRTRPETALDKEYKSVKTEIRTGKREKRPPVAKRRPASTSPRNSGSSKFTLPPLNLLEKDPGGPARDSEKELKRRAAILKSTLGEFAIEARIGRVEQGPVITRFEVHPAPGIKVEKISSLSNNIALAMERLTSESLPPSPGGVPWESKSRINRSKWCA